MALYGDATYAAAGYYINLPEQKHAQDQSCQVHPQYHKGFFCFHHNQRICVMCHRAAHKPCSVALESDVASMLRNQIDKYVDAMTNLRMEVDFHRSVTENNIFKVQTKRKHMIKDARAFHDIIIGKINKLYGNYMEEIFKVCKEHVFFFSKQKTRIDSVVSGIDKCLDNLNLLKEKHFSNETVLLKLQETVNHTRRYAPFLQALQQSSKIIDLSFDPGSEITEFLDSQSGFDSVRINFRECQAMKTMESFSYPTLADSSSKQTSTEIALKFFEGMQGLPTIVTKANQETAYEGNILQGLPTIVTKAHANSRTPENKNTLTKVTQITSPKFICRMNTFVKTKCDRKNCLINNIVITETGRKLLTDFSNHKVKLFSSNMKLKSTLDLSGAPRGLAYVGKNELVCTTDKNLHFIELVGDTLYLRYERKLKHSVYDVRECEGKLYLSRATSPPSVKKIDKAGKADWTVYKNKQGQKLFTSICHLTCSVLEGDIRVVATDYEAETVTVLDGKSGIVIAVRHLKGKGPRCVTTDANGNIYVCYAKTNEICMLSQDMSSDKILLSSTDGLTPDPLAIAYDYSSDQIIVSSNTLLHRETVAVFQKPFYV